MFPAIRAFFLDQATFSRVLSDLLFFTSTAAVTPGAAEAIGALAPGAGWIAPAVILASSIYSGSKRQNQAPPKS